MKRIGLLNALSNFTQSGGGESTEAGQAGGKVEPLP